MKTDWQLLNWQLSIVTDDYPSLSFPYTYPPFPQNCIFLIYGPILIRFGMNGPHIDGKWLKWLNWWLPIFSGPPPPPKTLFFLFMADFHKIWYKWSWHQWKMTDTIKRKIPTQDGQFPPKTDNSHPRLTIPTQDGQFLPKTDNSHPIRTILTQDGQFPPNTDNSRPRRTIPTQDEQFPPKTDNSHPRLTVPTQDWLFSPTPLKQLTRTRVTLS